MNIGTWLNWRIASMRSSTDQRRISTARKWMRYARRLYLKGLAYQQAAVSLAPEIKDERTDE